MAISRPLPTFPFSVSKHAAPLKHACDLAAACCALSTRLLLRISHQGENLQMFPAVQEVQREENIF